ncbi:DUF6587 family protein [Komagataeibacter sp. FNDCR2]|uniref:DUF6587 family protein n=1 Tax=Komagataeibacter sp. FNDCR2 TaxID=2878682 RepID=UPI001E2C2C19|nr:DUF6587 family protein [Komagataeibacter sp. FNDCR2]MCE2575867.1 hypothetical protein [Komagataeibacter sp. FNDCR2]
MAPGSLLQILLACGAVALCALYWAGRLFPAGRQKLWGATGLLLRRCHAPDGLVRYATRRSLPREARGCGGCSACAGKNRPPER